MSDYPKCLGCRERDRVIQSQHDQLTNITRSLPLGAPPRWVAWVGRGLDALERACWWIRGHRRRAACVLLVSLVALPAHAARAALTTIPAPSRPAQICAALGADEGCVTREIAHLRGRVAIIAFDPVPPGGAWNPVIALVQIAHRLLALSLVPASEQSTLATLDTPQTNYTDLVLAREAWPALRALAHVTDGVPVLLEARRLTPRPVVSTEALGEARVLRIRIALVQVR